MERHGFFSARNPPPLTLDEMWDKVLYGVERVLAKDLHKVSFDQVYTSVYMYCMHGTYHDANARSNLYFRLRDYLASYLQTRLEKGRVELERDVMTFYTSEWQNYRHGATLLADMFCYLNRCWIVVEIAAGRSDVFEIYHMCLVVWKSVVFDKLHEKILDTMCCKIFQDPSPEDKELMIKTVQAYVDLGLAEIPPHTESPKPQDKTNVPPIRNIFTQYFEKPILVKIENRFAEQARDFLKSHSITQYLEHVQLWYGDAVHPNILPPEFDSKLNTAIDKGLTEVHGSYIPDLCNSLLSCSESPTRNLLVRLAARSDLSRQILVQHLVNYFVCIGREAIAKLGKNDSCPTSFVTAVMDWRSSFNTILMKTFHEVQGLEAGVHKACATLVNEYPKKISTAELLVRYCDQSFRKVVNIATHISNAMNMLKYVEDKDDFLDCYIISFAARQLDLGMPNPEAELLMLAELKLACGPSSLYKLQKMCDDLRVTSEENIDFKSHVQTNQIDLQLDFSIKVLSSGMWPIKSSMLKLPSVLQNCQDMFEEYYSLKYSRRKLVWAHNHSKGVLKTTWSSRKFCNFYVSLPQMVLLLVFQERDVCTVGEIQDETKLDSRRLHQALKGLLRTKLLVCGTCVDDDDLQDASEIQFNQSYKTAKKHVIVKAHKSDWKEEDKVTRYQIESEQLYLCQAAIVRVMKAQKECQQEELVEKVKVALEPRFAATEVMLKKCLQILVEKEYLEKRSNNLYIYMP